MQVCGELEGRLPNPGVSLGTCSEKASRSDLISPRVRAQASRFGAQLLLRGRKGTGEGQPPGVSQELVN